MDESPGPRISAAAIRTDDGKVWTVPPPGRHHNVIGLIRAGGYEGPVSAHRQGFVTDAGEFVERDQAMAIARFSGQLLRETAPQHGLFSEDVW